MEFRDVKRDCAHFRGHIPCSFNKSEGAICSSCKHYKPIETRILIIKLAALGDVIRTTPLLVMFRRKYPNAHITWLTQSPEILPKNEIDQIYDLNASSIFVLENSMFDVVVNLDKEPEACMLMAKIEAVQKFGFTWEDHAVAPCTVAAEHKLMTGFFDQLSKQNTKSYLEEIFEICHESFHQEPYAIALDQQKAMHWKNTLHHLSGGKPIVALNTGCGPRWNTRLWSEERWTQLSHALKEIGFFPVFLGGALEHEKNERMAHSTGIYYPGHFDLKTFISLVDACDVVVTQVTMMMHIATALQKKMVLMNTIFNPHEFELYGRGVVIGPEKPCQCYYGNTCQLGEPCMNAIQAETIVEAVKSL